MRRKERIPIFLNKMEGNWDKLLKNIWKSPYNKKTRKEIVSNIENSYSYIKEYWERVYDLRISQVLVNCGFIDNFPGFWYYMEESEILLQLGIDKRDFYLWGNAFDKNMNRLPTVEYKPIKELTTDHIRSILDGGYIDHNSDFKQVFMEELRLRLTL